MENIGQLILQAKRIIDNMDPATKKSLLTAVRQQNRQGGNNPDMIRNVLQSMDPRTRQQLEQQLGVKLNQQTVGALDNATLNRLMSFFLRNQK